jgi:hypothetical protein
MLLGEATEKQVVDKDKRIEDLYQQNADLRVNPPRKDDK